MPNYDSPAQRITLTVASLAETSIYVEYYAGDSGKVSRTDYYEIHPIPFVDTIGVITIELDPLLCESRTSELKAFHSVHVYATEPIALSGYTYNKGSADGFLALPLAVLGKEYRTANYICNDTTYHGQFLIVAPYDNTQVTITPNGTTRNALSNDSHTAGQSYSVTLRQGQTYLVQSGGAAHSFASDLTGSRIESSQPVAVLSGHQYTKLDGIAGSTMVEMLPPVEALATNYYYSSNDNNSKTSVVIVAIDTGTFYYTLGLGSSISYQLNPGQHAEEVFANQAVNIGSQNGSKRFFCYELRRSVGEVSVGKLYRPTMSLVTSPQWQDSIFLLTIPTKFDPLSYDYSTTTTYMLRDSAARSLFGANPIPVNRYIPFGFKQSIWWEEKMGNSGESVRYIKGGKWKLAATVAGTTGDYSYSHPGSLRLSKRSPDHIKPALKNVSGYCGNHTFTVVDSLVVSPASFESGKLGTVRIITESHDVTAFQPLKNYRIITSTPFTPGISEYSIKLEVVNPKIDAYAAVYAQDLAGNDSVFVFSYKANRTQILALKTIGTKLPVGKEICYTVTIKAKNDSLASFPLNITSVSLLNGLTDPHITDISPSLPRSLGKDDSIVVTLCAIANDTLQQFRDSLIVFSDCYAHSYYVSAKGITGLLDAENRSFGEVSANTKVAQNVALKNRGDVPVTVFGVIKTGNSVSAFHIDTEIFAFPVIIQPKGYYLAPVVYQQSLQGKNDTAIFTWITDLPHPYENSIKTYSILTGQTKQQNTSVRGDESNDFVNIISISPNPFSNVFNLRYISYHTATLALYDVLGKEVYHTTLASGEHTERISMPTILSSGSYTLRLITPDGVSEQSVRVGK